MSVELHVYFLIEGQKRYTYIHIHIQSLKENRVALPVEGLGI